MYTDPIAYHAATSPRSIAVVVRKRHVPYAQFDTAINAIAHGLRPLLPDGDGAIGVHRSQRPYFDWLFTLALSRLNRTSVSIPIGAFPTSGYEFVQAVITTDAALNTPRAQVLFVAEAEAGRLLSTPLSGPISATGDPTRAGRVAVSSGTTGSPKPIYLSNALIVSRVKSGIFGSAMRSDSHVLCQLPIGTFGGFGVPVRTWCLGGTVYMGDVSLRDDIYEGPIRTIVTTPGGLENIVRKLPRGVRPKPDLTVVSGGGHLPPGLADRVHALLTPNLVMTYGSTETTTVAMSTAQRLRDDPELTGIVLPWAEVEIVDQHDRPLPLGSIGEVRIRSPEMVHEFIGNSELSAKTFRHGWFYPGDIGRLGTHRRLYIVGRRDFVLNLNGLKIAPERIEVVLLDVEGVRDVAVTSVRDSMGLAYPIALLVADVGFDESKAHAALRGAIPALGRVHFQQVDKIPRNDMNKVERHLLASFAREVA